MCHLNFDSFYSLCVLLKCMILHTFCIIQIIHLILCLSPVGQRTCSPDQFTCPTWYPGHARCVSQEYVCDGEKDCFDAADELQNCLNRSCHMNEFACANGRCILFPFQ